MVWLIWLVSLVTSDWIRFLQDVSEDSEEWWRSRGVLSTEANTEASKSSLSYKSQIQ